MSKVLCALILLATVLCVAAWAQAPTGTVAGVVTDESGAVIPNANVTVHNKATGVERTMTTGADGSFSAPALASGVYEVRVEMKGFRTVLREATVEVGSTTTSDIRMQVGQSSEVVTVEAAAAQVEYERHALDGVVTREQIQGLPLNGRSFLNLASIEPGVSVNIGSTSQYNAQFSVSILGADAGRTSYNVDGGNIRDSIEGTGPGMNFSQEVVQEFQLSSVNFDLSTGITAVGSVNIVTRSGSNDFHGSGYFFFRDHNMAAYPGLKRNPFNLDPFFARRNPGFWVGGPVVKDKLFFFFNFENQNQSSAVTFQPNLASLSGLAGNFTSPYKGKTLSARFDYKLNSKNTLFARYSHDGNTSVGPTGGGGSAPPSNWVVNANWSDQTVFGITTILKPTIVNDFRFSYQYWHNRNLFPTTADCGANCLGLDDIASQISVNGSNVTIGHSTNATQGRDLRKFQFDEGLTWQKGAHRIRFGGQIELAPGTGFWGYCDPMCGGVASPETVRGLAAVGIPVAALFPNLPTQVRTYQDFLNLPFLYSVIGVGDPSQPPPYNVDIAKKNNRFRLYGQDTWKIKPNFTLNYGLAWEYESNLFNHDIPKPAYIAPLYGSDLSPTNNNHGNFSPSLGFAWSPKKDNKTVVRAGAGIYYDTEYLFQRLQERAYLGPVGNGRVQVQNTAIINTIPGILDISAGVKPIAVGSPLPFAHLLTMTFGQFLGLYKAQIGPLTAALAPKNLNDLSTRNIDISKTSAQLYPKDYPLMSAIHLNAGIQHQFTRDLVVSVDFARRVFNHVDLGALDTNRFNRYINGVQSPVIPICSAAQAVIPKFQCSTGSDTFWTPGGRTVYNALLIKVDKRFSRHYQLTAGYALTDQHGYASTIYNLDNWSTSYGPQLSRQSLNVTGVVNLPWDFQLGLISTMATKGPQMAFVTGVDLTGSGVTPATTPLPGLGFNCLNRGCGQSELSSAVDSWNSTYAGKKDGRGQVMPTLALPPSYDFGRFFNSQDLRLTKTFKIKERYRISVFGEMFNVLNYFNPSGYNFNLDTKNANAAAQTYNFGIPTQRTGQTFGSGGPRAVQVGGRFTF
jgi:Carboxypeptidase regulatory-like domain